LVNIRVFPGVGRVKAVLDYFPEYPSKDVNLILDASRSRNSTGGAAGLSYWFSCDFDTEIQDWPGFSVTPGFDCGKKPAGPRLVSVRVVEASSGKEDFAVRIVNVLEGGLLIDDLFVENEPLFVDQFADTKAVIRNLGDIPVNDFNVEGTVFDQNGVKVAAFSEYVSSMEGGKLDYKSLSWSPPRAGVYTIRFNLTREVAGVNRSFAVRELQVEAKTPGFRIFGTEFPPLLLLGVLIAVPLVGFYLLDKNKTAVQD
jgi:hypothetical protein